jgi:hypothetical protein
MKKKTVVTSLIVILLSVMLASCSGGGSNGGGGSTSYTVGGTVSGLSGTGLVLQNNGGDDLTITTSGTFTFATSIADGAAYAVTIKTQPASPLQTCTVNSGSGTVSGTNVTNVSVVCSTNAYSVGGTVSGLFGSGLVLQNNGGDDLAIAANGTFTFAAMVADGAGYTVTVKTQPTGQTCTVNNGSGTMAGANVATVAVVCSLLSAPTNISALSGAQKSTVSWTAVAGATSYNIYYANSTGITKATGTKIAGVTSPYHHLYLNTGTYYYVVTAVNAYGESAESLEVSVPINLLTFVTSTTGNGNLTSWPDAGGNTDGLKAADAICQARAVAGGFTGTFKAWISYANVDAYCHIRNVPGGYKNAKCGLQPWETLPAAGPWVRTDGFPFGEAIDSLDSFLTPTGKVYAPIRLDEFGNQVADGTIYFTNTLRDGTNDTSYLNPCSQWTSSSGPFMPRFGAADMTTDAWSQWAQTTCAANHPLLCMQVGAGPALPAFASTGKKIFITSTHSTGDLGGWTEVLTSGTGTTGIHAGDVICQTRASAVGLANAAKFKAWLSDSTVNAKDRISSNGPWVRIDGVPVANSKADLTDGSIFTAINLTETGVYISLTGARIVWTGTGSNGTKSSDTCNGWTDASTYSGTAGGALNAGADWADYSVSSCSYNFASLYCIED